MEAEDDLLLLAADACEPAASPQPQLASADVLEEADLFLDLAAAADAEEGGGSASGPTAAGNSASATSGPRLSWAARTAAAGAAGAVPPGHQARQAVLLPPGTIPRVAPRPALLMPGQQSGAPGRGVSIFGATQTPVVGMQRGAGSSGSSNAFADVGQGTLVERHAGLKVGTPLTGGRALLGRACLPGSAASGATAVSRPECMQLHLHLLAVRRPHLMGSIVSARLPHHTRSRTPGCRTPSCAPGWRTPRCCAWRMSSGCCLPVCPVIRQGLPLCMVTPAIQRRLHAVQAVHSRAHGSLACRPGPGPAPSGSATGRLAWRAAGLPLRWWGRGASHARRPPVGRPWMWRRRGAPPSPCPRLPRVPCLHARPLLCWPALWHLQAGGRAFVNPTQARHLSFPPPVCRRAAQAAPTPSGR